MTPTHQLLPPAARERHQDQTIPVLLALTAIAAVAGLVSGLLLAPDAAPLVASAGAAQGVATLAIAQFRRRPVPVSVITAVVCVSTTLATPLLTDVASRGVAGWAPLAIVTSTQLVVRHSRGPLITTIGAAALVTASAAPLALHLAAGLPLFAAIQSAAVPLLVGSLIAVHGQLSQARRDRLARSVPPVDQVLSASTAPPGSPQTAAGRHPQLLIAVLRLEQLAADTADPADRRALADVNHLLRTVLDGHDGAGTIRVEITARDTTGATTERRPQEPATSLTSLTSRTSPTDGPRTAEALGPLSDREREVLRLVTTGAPNAAIGRDLYLSEATVKQYVSRLMRRFRCDNRTQLALLAQHFF